MWTIPQAPAELSIPLRRSWNGATLDDPSLHGFLALAAEPKGLRIRGGLADPAPGPAPSAPPGTRVANLWETDVVELFWVGPGGRYVEVELGAYGHFLVLSFCGPRNAVDGHETFRPEIRHRRDAEGWTTGLRVPWELLPEPLEALNAFALARGAFVAAYPLPGTTPDFHQPTRFPSAQLEGR